MTSDEREFEDLARELRQGVGAEFRAEAAEMERQAALAMLRKRGLPDVAHELMSRGDLVSVGTAERELRGRIVYARRDLAILQTEAGAEVEVNLSGPVHLAVRRRARRGGESPARGSGSFRARLHEHEQAGGTVEVIAPGSGVSVTGRLGAVGTDHVVVVDRDGSEWFVPVREIAWLIRPGG